MTHTELEIERFSILIQSFCDELIKSVHDAGGDPDYLESWPEKMIDDMKLCFQDAAERRAEAARPSRPYSTLNPVQLGTSSAVARVS